VSKAAKTPTATPQRIALREWACTIGLRSWYRDQEMTSIAANGLTLTGANVKPIPLGGSS